MKKQLKIRRWRNVRFSPVIRRDPRNPVFNDFDENAFGKRTRPTRAVLVPSEHSGLPLRPTGCPLPSAQVCASQRGANTTRARFEPGTAEDLQLTRLKQHPTPATR
ncbi:MAG: hypothetical protein WAO35_19190 [Terriglobia bacterium]